MNLSAFYREAWRDSWHHVRSRNSDGSSKPWRGKLDERAFWCLETRRERDGLPSEASKRAVDALRARGWDINRMGEVCKRAKRGLVALVPVAAELLRAEKRLARGECQECWSPLVGGEIEDGICMGCGDCR